MPNLTALNYNRWLFEMSLLNKAHLPSLTLWWEVNYHSTSNNDIWIKQELSYETSNSNSWFESRCKSNRRSKWRFLFILSDHIDLPIMLPIEPPYIGDCIVHIVQSINHVGSSNKMGIFVYYSYIQTKLGNLGGVILPTLCIGIIIHPKNIHGKHYSSCYYSLRNSYIHSITIIEIEHFQLSGEWQHCT